MAGKSIFATLQRRRSQPLAEVAGKDVVACRVCGTERVLLEGLEPCSCGHSTVVLRGTVEPGSPLVESVRKVVRDGVVTAVPVRRVRKRMTTAQRQALNKARMLANTAAAKRQRSRSRAIGQSRELY